jgi:Na+/melibiose symporter-like transporter
VGFGAVFIGVLGSVIYKQLSKKIEIKTLVVWGRSLQIILSLVTFGLLFIPGLDFVVWITIVVNGILGGFMVFDTLIMSLVMDEDEIVHGQRREGLILGTNAFFNKIAESIAPILGTTILLIFGFKQGELTQSPGAILGIKVLFLIVPAIVNFIALLGIIFFPIYGENLKNLQIKLHVLHSAKEKEYQKLSDSNSRIKNSLEES